MTVYLCPLLRTLTLFLDNDVISFDDVNPAGYCDDTVSLCPLLTTFILFLDDVINFDDVNPLAIVLALCPCVPELECSYSPYSHFVEKKRKTYNFAQIQRKISILTLK